MLFWRIDKLWVCVWICWVVLLFFFNKEKDFLSLGCVRWTAGTAVRPTAKTQMPEACGFSLFCSAPCKTS